MAFFGCPGVAQARPRSKRIATRWSCANPAPGSRSMPPSVKILSPQLLGTFGVRITQPYQMGVFCVPPTDGAAVSHTPAPRSGGKSCYSLLPYPPSAGRGYDLPYPPHDQRNPIPLSGRAGVWLCHTPARPDRGMIIPLRSARGGLNIPLNLEERMKIYLEIWYCKDSTGTGEDIPLICHIVNNKGSMKLERLCWCCCC